MKRISYRIANFILIAALLLSGAVTAHAASTTEASEKVQLRSDCTLDVTYSSEGMVFAGQDIKLWHIADITEDAQYALAGSFRSYPIQVTGTSSQSEWDEMTITLNSYILADGIAADQTAKTDARGKVVFDNLTAGIYLVSSVRTEQDGKYYVFESFLAAVPGVDSEGQWVYSVSARPKMSVHTPAKGEVTYKAVKAWRDGGQDRPVSVSVEVRRDGQLQQSVTLSAENNWMYTWKAVDDGSVWTVNEVNVPEGYTVGIQRSGETKRTRWRATKRAAEQNSRKPPFLMACGCLTLKSMVMGAHSLTARPLRFPQCGHPPSERPCHSVRQSKGRV